MPYDLTDLDLSLFEPDVPIYYEKDYTGKAKEWERNLAFLCGLMKADPKRLKARSRLSYHQDRIWALEQRTEKIPDSQMVPPYKQFLPRLETFVEEAMGRIVVRPSDIRGFIDIHLYVPYLYLDNLQDLDLLRDLGQTAELLAVHPYQEGLFVEISLPHRMRINYKPIDVPTNPIVHADHNVKNP